MKVLVACEFSGIVRDAFIRHGHDAISCDLLPSESDFGPHIIGDVRTLDLSSYDLMVAHPPCTHLAAAGAMFFPYKLEAQTQALAFVLWLLAAPIPRIALENPVGVISTRIRPSDDSIEPFQFGAPFKKKTQLWLKNLPRLIPTKVVPYYSDTLGRNIGFRTGEYSTDRQTNRSRTFAGVAEAMAVQWGEPSKYTHVFRDGEHIIFNQELTENLQRRA